MQLEFMEGTGKRRHSLRGTGQFHTVNMVKELDLTAEAGDILGDPHEEPMTVTSEVGYDLTIFDLDAVMDEL